MNLRDYYTQLKKKCEVTPMNVLFQNRPDVFKNIGGDTVQMLKTLEYLQKEGIQVDVSTELTPNLDKYDIVHLFNTTRIAETYIQALNAKKQRKLVVISPIYWNMSEYKKWVRKELIPRLPRYSSTEKSVKKLVKTLFFKNKRIQKIYHKLGDIRLIINDKRLFQKQYAVLHLANAILPNSYMEMEQIVKSFGVPAEKCTVVPNAAEEKFAEASPREFIKKYNMQNFVLSVAAIGARKNTHSLIKAASLEDLPLILIGTCKENEYVKLCKEEALRGKVMFLGKIDHESNLLISAYAAAKVHALVSWYETPGLSSLEAGLAGCNIVTTDRGTTQEYFGDMVWYCNPSDILSIRKALRQAYNSPKNDKLKAHIMENYTWKKAAKLTIKAYKKIIEE